MNLQYPEFDGWCDQRPVAFWQRRVRRSPGSTSASSRPVLLAMLQARFERTFKTLGRSLPGIRYGLGKRRYREIARWTSLCCVNFQYPEFDRWCDQRPVAFWQRRVRRSPGSTSASSTPVLLAMLQARFERTFKTVGR